VITFARWAITTGKVIVASYAITIRPLNVAKFDIYVVMVH
jgi:hypothetical protein